tara:strand:- start:7908 stop:8339 length:432 start_codon:yes stop_codon:yes gene_type:complete
MLNHAKDTDFDTVWNIFKNNKKYFPHIRTDYLKRNIAKGQVVLDRDVIIVYNIYKRKQRLNEEILAQPGDCILHQIVAKNRNGSAKEVLHKFFKHINTRVFLSVRSENDIAKKFYEKNGMLKIGDTSWAKGTISGDIYLYDSN